MNSPHLPPTTYHLPLRRWWAASALVAVTCVPVALLAMQTLRIVVATRLADSTEIPQVRRALALDPSNARLYDRLGMLLYQASSSLGQGDPKQSAEYLRRAVELNPHQVFYWSDLGAICEVLGDRACADHAFERSVELSPRTPQTEWLAANHCLRTGQTLAALARFQRLLTLDPSYSQAVFALCLRVLDDPEIVLEKVLPRRSDRRVQMAFVNTLADRGQPEFAFKVWSQSVALESGISNPESRGDRQQATGRREQGTGNRGQGTASSIPLAPATRFLEHLIELGREQEAQAVWQELLRSGTVSRPQSRDQETLIFNGDFEQTPLNAGFDWRYSAMPYLWLDFADPAAYRSSRCLRVEFTVKQNQEYEPVDEIVPVAPDQRYLLTAFARTEGITSDSGPRLRVVDVLCPACLEASSSSEVGTTPWHRVSLSFSTKASTRFVKVSIWRPRCRTFPTEISGIFWLDDVSLKPIGPATAKPVADP